MDQIIQQGDVILKLRKKLPLDAKRVAPEVRGYVLAEGEATGHAHTIAHEYGELFERNGTLWLKVDTAAPLVHQEHDTQTIPPGIYEVGKVVEVDPFTEEVRSVMD